MLCQPPVSEGGPAQLSGAAVGQILGGHPVVVLTHEDLKGTGLVGGQLLPHPAAHRLDQLGLESFGLYRHIRHPSRKLPLSTVPPSEYGHAAAVACSASAGGSRVPPLARTRCAAAPRPAIAPPRTPPSARPPALLLIGQCVDGCCQ